MKKNSLFVRILGGALLLYQGYTLLRSVLADRPENMMMFLVTSIVFIILGAYFMFIGCKKYIKHDYIDPNLEDDEDETEEQLTEQSEEQE